MADRLGDYIAGSAIEIIETEKLIRRYKDKIIERIYYHGKSTEEVILELQKVLEKKRVRMNTYQVPFVYKRSPESTKNIEAWKKAKKITEGRDYVRPVTGTRYERVAKEVPPSSASSGAEAPGSGSTPIPGPSEARFALYSRKISIAQTKRVVYQSIARVSKVTEGGKLSLKPPAPSVAPAKSTTSSLPRPTDTVVTPPTHLPAAATTPAPPRPRVAAIPPLASSSGIFARAAAARARAEPTRSLQLTGSINETPSLTASTAIEAPPPPPPPAPAAVAPKVLVVNANVDLEKLEAMHKASKAASKGDESDEDSPSAATAKTPSPPPTTTKPALPTTDKEALVIVPDTYLWKPFELPTPISPTHVQPQPKLKPTPPLVLKKHAEVQTVPVVIDKPARRSDAPPTLPPPFLLPPAQEKPSATVTPPKVEPSLEELAKAAIAKERPPFPTIPPPVPRSRARTVDNPSGERSSSATRRGALRRGTSQFGVDMDEDEDWLDNTGRGADERILVLLAFALVLLAMAVVRPVK